jgi:transcriptional regulator with XRE-family HTH domain
MSADPTMRLPEVFGRLLKQRRVELKGTEGSLAGAAGLSGGADDVEKVERGEREPTLSEFFAIASALRTSPGLLLVDLITAWRGDFYDPLYKARASDFERVYRLGFFQQVSHNHFEFREVPTTYHLLDQATAAARELNARRYKKGQPLLDTVSIYIRMGTSDSVGGQGRTSSGRSDAKRPEPLAG